MYIVKSLSPRNNPAWTHENNFEEAQKKARELRSIGHINVRIYLDPADICTDVQAKTESKAAVPA